MAKKPAMTVVALAATKGGVGKTTLAAALAVRAAQDGGKVALLDADPQASVAKWWELRGEPDNPKFIDIDPSIEALELLISEGWEWVFIDTPPAKLELIETALFSSDFVLIPSRASAIDLEAMGEVVDLCNAHAKPFAFVLNAVMPGWENMADQAAQYLKNHGTVLGTRVSLRKAYASAMTLGKTGAETEKGGKAREEIDALWKSVKRLSAKGRGR